MLNKTIDERDLPKYLAEFFGTLVLVFSICLAVVSADNGNLTLKDVALVHFFVLGMLVNALGSVSGAHFNPAITIQFLFFGHISILNSFFYIITQLMGAIIGALLAKTILSPGYIATSMEHTKLANNFVAQDLSVFRAFFLELIMTFILTFVVRGHNSKINGNGRWGGWLVGGTVATGVLLIGPLTGNSMNPARSLGPLAMIREVPDYHWIFWMGPITGALLAGLLSMLFFNDTDIEETPPELNKSFFQSFTKRFLSKISKKQDKVLTSKNIIKFTI
jgi:MIP family channel proteins